MELAGMAEMAGNCWKLQEMTGNDQNMLELAGKGWKGWKLPEMA